MKCSLNIVDEPKIVVSLVPETISPGVSVKSGCTDLLTRKVLAFMTGFLLLAVVIFSALLISCHLRVPAPTPVPALDIPQAPQIPTGNDGILSKGLRFVERAEWGAQPPVDVMNKLHLPVPYVIISHTVTDYCDTQSDCTLRVRFAQTFHIETRDWSDIAYNFLIGGDGYAYVGRSWEYVGPHSYGYDTKSIGISFIGTFNKVVPPEQQLLAAQRLIQFGVEHGKIAPDYKLLGHRQISKTHSPGDALYNVIQTWPHWSPTP